MNDSPAENFKSGFVTIIGRPNSGKSTILNYLVGNKISIVSPIPQTTRHQIRAILNIPGAQIVFVDTPGIHRPEYNLAGQLNSIAKASMDGCDLVLYVVDVSRKTGQEEEAIMDFLTNQRIRIVMAMNKIDLGDKHIEEYVKLWKDKLTLKNITSDPVIYYLPVSAKTGKNMDVLLQSLVENLPIQPSFYDDQTPTDFPLKFRIADSIREKLFLNLHKELPHSIAVEVEEIKEKARITYVRAIIYVNRPSQKKIVIGTKGEILKEAGSMARQDIERIIGRKVYLELWVKVVEDWQSKTRILKELGYCVE